MARTKSAVSNSSVARSNKGLAFGGQVKQVVLPSGSKLVFNEPDQDGIIKVLGFKDLSEKVGKEDGEVVYLIGNDGKRIVSIALSYKLKEAMKAEDFVPGHYYYFHLADLVVTNESFNKMKDFEIADLGEEGGKQPVQGDRLPGISEIELTLDSIKKLNYEMLNYPLRTV